MMRDGGECEVSTNIIGLIISLVTILINVRDAVLSCVLLEYRMRIIDLTFTVWF